MENFPRLMALSDLVERWTYTRAGLQNLIKTDAAFPKPVAVVNGGRTRIWMVADIENYERGHPWVCDPEAKERHVRLHQLRWFKGTGA